MNKIFIIGEAGVNHNGRLDLALALCRAAKEAGVDAVKFQTFKTERNISRWAPTPAYQRTNGSRQSQFELIKGLELTPQAFARIKAHCDDIGIEFLSTPDDRESLRLLLSLGMRRIKVASGEVTNLPFLSLVGKCRTDVLLSTGMSYLSEVEGALRTLTAAGAKSVTLLHCTTQYPCPFDEVNLRAMHAMKEAFKTPVGYSDHTTGLEAAIAAAALGARVIEKHFTLDPDMLGPDHKASLPPDQLKHLVQAIRNVEACMGDGIKRPTPGEERIKGAVRRRAVAARDILRGEALTRSLIAHKRAPDGVPVESNEFLLGRRVRRHIQKDRAIRWEDLQ